MQPICPRFRFVSTCGKPARCSATWTGRAASALLGLVLALALAMPKRAQELDSLKPAAPDKLEGICHNHVIWDAYIISDDGIGYSYSYLLSYRVLVWCVKGGAELPLPVFRRQAPRWARGWVGDPRARSRAPPTSAPFAKKK
jgi:hypothetical protein